MRAWELFEGIQLNEVIEDNLYHYMSPEKALSVFSSDAMPGKWIHDIPGLGERKGNSFTRNKNFPGSASNKWMRITVDKQKLAQTNKIIPLDAERIYQYTNKRWERSENPPSFSDIKHSDRKIHNKTGVFAEEFIIGDILNLHRDIKKIEIISDSMFSNSNLASVEVAEKYSEKYGIEFVDHRPKRPDWYGDE